MKILHTADWHIGQFKGPVVDGVNLRLQDTVKCLEYMHQFFMDQHFVAFMQDLDEAPALQQDS